MLLVSVCLISGTGRRVKEGVGADLEMGERDFSPLLVIETLEREKGLSWLMCKSKRRAICGGLLKQNGLSALLYYKTMKNERGSP